MSKPVRPLIPYGVAVLSVGVAFGVRLALGRVLAADVPFLLFFAAVMVSAWYGGLWPGLVATVLSELTVDYFFLEPRYALFSGTLQQNLPLALFVIEGGAVSWLSDRLKTARRRNEQEKVRYRSLVIATTQIVWTTDPRGLVTGDVPTWREFTGQTLSQIQGDGWAAVVHQEDRERVRTVWSKAVATGTLYDTEYRLLRRDGQYRDMAVRGVPVMGHDRNIREWVGTCTDITEHKKAQEELARHQRNLEDLVQQRTAELERSNKDLEQFAYVASHDLQEPLRMVSGYMQLLERQYKSKLDADADKFINFAVDGAKRMQQLINDLLAYARVRTRGKEFGPTDCNEVLQTVQEDMVVAIEESQAAISHDPLPTVDADKTQLCQLFQNLIANAIKFRGSRRPEIHVGAKEKDGLWELSVKDNGIGIEPQYFDRIFEIFQRLHDRSCYPGTGIGLAICKKIVERHGGTMWVESQPDKGSTFFFTLPKAGRQP